MRILNVKSIVVIAIMALGIAGVSIFTACKKDEAGTRAETQITNSAEHKWFYTEGYAVQCATGWLYIGSTAEEAWWQTLNGGHIWIYLYDKNGNKIGRKVIPIFPTSSNGSGNSYPSPIVGTFVQQTIIDIMNASLDDRRDIVIENEDGIGDELTKLSALIDNTLIEKVISGEYIISSITETITENASEDELKFEYLISFSSLDDSDFITIENTVSFVLKKNEEDVE